MEGHGGRLGAMSTSLIVSVAGQLRHRTGWRRSPLDLKDHKLRAVEGYPLPLRNDCWNFLRPPRDQGSIGDCVGFGIAFALWACDIREGRPPVDLSALFIYDMGRICERTRLFEDTGLCIRNGVKATLFYGAPPESAWPSLSGRGHIWPSEEAFAEARHNQIALGAYLRVERVGDVKAAIQQGYPVIFGLDTCPYFETQTAVTGELPWNPIAPRTGGHCMLIAGWDDEKVVDGERGAFEVLNTSWGRDFGRDGRFWMPYLWWTSGKAESGWIIMAKKDPEKLASFTDLQIIRPLPNLGIITI